MIGASLLSIALAAAATASASAQTTPNAYQPQLENAWVKVVRVHYEPHQRLPEHQHPGGPNIYVYLIDGGPVLFKHEHGDSGGMAAVRPPTKARAYRLAAAREETHIVENQSDVPSDFLEVGLKTDITLKTFAGRHESDMPGTATASRVEFDTDQIRVTRVRCAAASACEPVTASYPTLRIDLSSSGRTDWFEQGAAVRYAKLSSPSEYLLVELKSKQVSTR